jgi:hypothetical protein
VEVEGVILLQLLQQLKLVNQVVQEVEEMVMEQVFRIQDLQSIGQEEQGILLPLVRHKEQMVEMVIHPTVLLK